MVDKGSTDGLLGLTAEFDVKSGYLLVDGEGVLGKQHRGAYDTYTNTLTHHIGRDDVAVFTRNFVRSSRASGSGVAQDMVFAPRKGDRILSINYRELVPPGNWLDVDPPAGGKTAWNTEGRRLLWKDYIESQWTQAVEETKSINPTYVELGRGVGGWLSVTYEPYGLCLNWLSQADSREGGDPEGKDKARMRHAVSPPSRPDKAGRGKEGGEIRDVGATMKKKHLLPNWAGMAIDSR
jgi:hypothetical protein